MSFWNDLTGTVSSQQQQQLASGVQNVNPGDYQISGLTGYLGNLNSLNTQAGALGSTSAINYAQGQEQGVFGQLQGLANGSTPGEGQALLQQGLNQSMDQQTSQALTNQGGSNPALGARQIASSGAQLSGQAGSQAATVGAQQQMQALAQQSSLAQNIRSQNYAQAFQGLQQQQQIQDQQFNESNQQTNYNIQQGQNQQAYQQWQYQQAYANAQQQAQGWSSLLKAGLGAAASVASGGLTSAIGGAANLAQGGGSASGAAGIQAPTNQLQMPNGGNLG